MRRLFLFLAVVVTGAGFSATAKATTLAEFNYNAGSSPGNATTGVGSSSGFFFPFSSALPVQTGSPNDTNPIFVNTGLNNASGDRSGPAIGEASGTRNATWRTSTEGFFAPTLTWDFMQGYRASRYYQMEVTYNGTDFVSLPAGGTGSSLSGPFGTASIDATGLIDIRTIDGLIDDAMGTGYMHDLSYAFPAGTAADDNPDFGYRIAAVWDPQGSDFVSSFAGTDGVNDTVSGYIRSTSSGGNQIRYDLVRITGTAIPEPSSLAIVGATLAWAGVRRRAR